MLYRCLNKNKILNNSKNVDKRKIVTLKIKNFKEKIYKKIIKKVKIIHLSLPPLIIEDRLNSNIQIVCNYLKNYENTLINKADIYIEGVWTMEKEKE